MTADYPIRLEPATQRWRAYFNHHVIADTADALVVLESGLPPVVYFPRQDVAMEYMGRTDRSTRCPHKGEASYFTLTMGGVIEENVAWSYEHPNDAVAPIAGRIAFYADRVEIYAVRRRGGEPASPRRRTPFRPRGGGRDGAAHRFRGRDLAARALGPNVEGPDGGVR